MLLLMADNDEDKKENLKFLHEFHCFREEFGDDCVPVKLREAVHYAEYVLNIEELTVFKKDSTVEWNEGPILINGAVTVRDNDDRKMREIFCEENHYWRPLFGYKEREKLAMECCSCIECRFLTKKRLHREECLPDISRSYFDQHYTRKGDEAIKCTKSKFYFPHFERDDDEGEYPPDDHYINVTGPALEEGMAAMQE